MNTQLPPIPRSILQNFIEEDLGYSDITSASLSNHKEAKFSIISNEKTVICGIDTLYRIANELFMLYNVPNDFEILSYIEDGTSVNAKMNILEGKMNAKILMASERLTLNIMQNLCGIATITREYVSRLDSKHIRILDTRKTTPMLRNLEKYAVRVGGGYNHRYGLYDGALIKDNHRVLYGSITNAVNAIRNFAPTLTKIEVECDTLEDVREAILCNPDVIMCDNMDIETIEEAIKIIGGKAQIEVSGGVDLESISSMSNLNIDYISVGKLTNGNPVIDLSLEVTQIL